MDRKKTKLVAGIFVLAVVATAVGSVVSARGPGGPGGPGASPSQPSGCWCLMNQLTEEQREEAVQELQEFREKQRQEALEFRQQLFANYNLSWQDCPGFVDEDGDGVCDNWGVRGGRWGGSGCGFWK